MQKKILNIIEKIIDIFFPTKCGICGKLGDYICEDCFKILERFKIKRQHKEIFFAYNYAGKIRELILKYKFDDKSYLYKTFTKMLLKNKKLCKYLKSYDIILSVPLHKKRLKQRGYNQSQLIAEELVKQYNLHNDRKLKELTDKNKKSTSLQYKDTKKLFYYNNVIIKTKNIKPQSTKSLKERINDVVRNL